MDDESVRRRASERLKAIASQAVSREKVRAALATKLVALGLTLLCFAGGLDYFSQSEAVTKALAGLARDSGQADLLEDLEKVGGTLEAWKRAALEALPDTAREWAVLVTLVGGAVALAWGLRLELGSGTPAERGRAMWDVGRVVLGPGVVGGLAYAFVSFRGFPVLRRTTSGFVDKLRAGALSWGDVGALTVKYHGWTWHEVGPVLVVGVTSVAAALTLGVVERRRAERAREAVALVRRACWALALLALTYYAAVTAVAVASYGAGLPVVTWPWKVRPATFLLTLTLMSLGAGIAWTGRRLMRAAATQPAAAG